MNHLPFSLLERVSVPLRMSLSISSCIIRAKKELAEQSCTAPFMDNTRML